ncbi:hypothetical protein G7046_g607 [Stylonectria norvegica]|nr:hypothetical protein G7046_g607 [Stylonectria norvegica]
MAFSSFSNSANAMQGNTAGAGGLSVGPDLETIQTEALGFLSIAGDAKLRLTSPWPSLPASTSSLISIASRKGLVAAAGPDQVILASTEAVRKAFESPKDGDSDIRAFEPQLKIQMPMRVSQLAFTADENYLILSAETGGGLAVYDVQRLLQGSTDSAFELSTNGEGLRLLIPNPTPERAELCAIVTNNGNLYMANLKERVISNPLKNQVSCISWSAKGKQLCAGLGDGTVYQMTPEGEGKAEIPKPPNVGDCHVSSLTWLENNLWLSIHTSNNETPPSSIYHIITRQPPETFGYQKMTDPVEPFGSEKIPHHSILRLRDFPPALQDLLIVSSTASTELGVLSRSKTALASDKPAESITGVFTTTEFLDDTKRPTLPMTDTMDDSTPIGVALDLSSKERVYKPIPSDVELEESTTPLPGLWVLTHEGILCSWWVIYNDSIKQGQAYPGLTAAAAGTASVSAPALAAPAPPAATFGSPGTSAFGSSATPAFGTSAQLGQKTSPWATAATTASPASTGGATFGSTSFGGSPAAAAPAFGKPSSLGFGQSSQLGMRASPWASSPGAATSSPSQAQPAFSSFANNASPFGSAASAATPAASGGFAGFSSHGGFASVSGSNSNGSVFGSASKPPAANPFGSASNSDTAFPPKDNPSSVFGSTPFKLESSFKPDPSATEADNKPATQIGSSLFGNSFGSALNDAASKSAAKDDDMGDMESTEQTPQAKQKSSLFPPQASPESTTPTSTPAPSKFSSFSTTPAPTTSVFGQPSKPPSFSGGLFGAKPDTPKSGGGLFGSQQATPRPAGDTTGSPQDTPKRSSFGGLFSGKQDQSEAAAQETKTPKIKVEEEEEAPLPPDTTSRVSYPVGDSSSSSAASNAASQPFGATTITSEPAAAPLPSDDNPPTPETVKPASNPFATSSQPDDPLPPDFVNVSKPAEKSKPADNVALPSFTKPHKPAVSDAPLPPDPIDFMNARAGSSNAPFKNPFKDLPVPESESDDSDDLEEDEDEEEDEGEEEEDEGEDESESEGSGIDVAKDLSPSVSGLTHTPGFTPQSSFGGLAGTTPATARPGQEAPRALFGEISRNAPVFPRPNATSPRSPSPIRGAVPNRVIRTEATRSVSAPGMASNLLGSRNSKSQMGASIISKERGTPAADPFTAQHRRIKARQEAEEAQPLVDEEDDEVQKILTSKVEGSLTLDEFVAHPNVVPPAKESIPGQVEAVYRDINSMIDALGLNSRAVKSFIKGHTENRKEGGRDKDDVEISDDWVLCEIDDLGMVLDEELQTDLEDGRVRELDDKLEACQELAKEMHRLRAKQEDLKKIIMVRMDPDQAESTRTMPLSAEQATQQNELRREYASFSKLLSDVEEALTLLKTRIASITSASGRGSANVPTFEAIMRTITKMTTMAEKRSGDIDVLENQMRRVRLGSVSREGSPMMTPQGKRSVIFSPDSTPVRNLRHSFAGSVTSFGASLRGTPPRKKLSGFSKEEKGDLMERRARRQAVLEKLKGSVEKKGVSVWNMEDIE